MCYHSGMAERRDPRRNAYGNRYRRTRRTRRTRRGASVRLILLIAVIAAAAVAALLIVRNRPHRAVHPLDTDLSGRVICIDPGHGGSQVGADAEGIYESDLNLAIALCVRDTLRQAGATVVMTRETDEDVPLEERARIANDAGAEVFVSIHQNITPENDSVNGAETWIYSADTADAVTLGSHIQSCLTARTGSDDRGLYESSELAVLRLTQMTACLVECGFMSNHAELARLASDDYQALAAYGIAEGIALHLSGAEAPRYPVLRQS